MQSKINSVFMRSLIIGFGLMILCLLILFKIAEFSFIKGEVKLEIIVAISAMVFFFVGLYFNHSSQKKHTSTQPQQSINQVPPPINHEQIKKLGLTQREYEVLSKMAEGLSNQEIASQLFVSESTIKTHTSNIFLKLEVKRRTQAIQVARQLKIVV